MNKLKRTVLQIIRAVLALITVLWTLSLLMVFEKVFGEPGFFSEHWVRVSLAIAVVFLPAWGYIKLTELLAPKASNDADIK